MRIIINENQLPLLVEFAEQKGQILAKHLPNSSKFKSIKGDWKTIWIGEQGIDKWPNDPKKKMVTCHIVDIKTRKVYLYPKTQSENASIEGHEDDIIFLAEKRLLTEFKPTDVDCKNLEAPFEVLLKEALSKISFL